LAGQVAGRLQVLHHIMIRGTERRKIYKDDKDRENFIGRLSNFLPETQTSSTLKKFQNALSVPAVQLIDEDGGYRMFSNNDQSILVAPAHQWFSQLL
jgi:hypothetical protein